MRQSWTAIGVCLALAGCGNQSGTLGKQADGTFEGTIAGKDYQVPVDCFNFSDPYFQFKSAETEPEQGDRKGITISGMQEADDKLILTVVDGSEVVRSGTINEFEKSKDTLTAKGELKEDGTSETYSVSFTVTCQQSGG